MAKVKTATIEMELGQLWTGLAAALPAASKDDTRPHLNGVAIVRDDNRAAIVATSGHWLSIYHADFEIWHDDAADEVFIPLPAAVELEKKLRALARKQGRHPVDGSSITFGASTIERWFYAARDSSDPLRTLAAKIRKDVGRHKVMSDELLSALRQHNRRAAGRRFLPPGS